MKIKKGCSWTVGTLCPERGGRRKRDKKTPLKVLLTPQVKIFIRETAADDGLERNLIGNGLPWQQCTSAGFLLAC